MDAPELKRAAAEASPGSKSQRLGRPPSPPGEVRGNRVVTFVTDAQLEELKRLALQCDTSLSGICFRILQARLDNDIFRNVKI
jgi:hypothetical protein